MPKIVKDHQIIDDSWQVITEEQGSLDSEQLLLPYAQFETEAATLRQEGKMVGIWLDSDFDFEALNQIERDQCPVIAINFPKFADGRGYSLARILREQLQFKGEIRAIGDVLLDQLYYLSRVGFDAFALRWMHMHEKSRLMQLHKFPISWP